MHKMVHFMRGICKRIRKYCPFPSKNFLLFLVLIFLLVILTFITQSNHIIEPLLISTLGCQIAKHEVYNDEVEPFLKTLTPIKCHKFPPLILSNSTSIWMDEESRIQRNLPENVDCCYKRFWRGRAASQTSDIDFDNVIEFSHYCTPFNKSGTVYGEFIEVQCTVNGTLVYRDYHAFVVVHKLKRHWQRMHPHEKTSVLVIGLDSVSRLNLYRQMPQTLDYIRKLDAIELLGFNKIGDGAFPNKIALLTGKSLKELKKDCWPTEDTAFDNCKFIFNDYGSHRYVTIFGEDTSYVSFFQDGKKGFYRTPTDVYLPTYMNMNENPETIGHSVNSKRACSGSRLSLEVLFDHCKKFTQQMTSSDIPYWGYFWGNSLSNELFNIHPNADSIYESVFRFLNDSGVLEKTVVIFLSDHGMRTGSYRNTYQGYLEERLPFAFFLIPQRLKNENPKAIKCLERNAHVLTTHYDIWQTMKDLLNRRKYGYNDLNGLGSTLFGTIPDSRTCHFADIGPHECACHRSWQIATTNAEVQNCAEAVIYEINRKLRPYADAEKCSILHIEKINSARLKDTGYLHFRHKEFVLTIQTTPGTGLYEATVNYDSAVTTATVMGAISRTNDVGDNGNCVNDKEIMLYCHCKYN